MARGAALAFAVVLLCCAPLPQQAAAAFFFGGRSGFGEEKVPMTVVVSSYSPRPAPTVPVPAPAPMPVPGSGDDNDDDMPRLPSARWIPGAPSSGNAGATAPAASGTSTAFISSNPAVPLPAGVTDSATVLPMPTPGQEHRQDMAMGSLIQVRTVPFAVPSLVFLFSWALWFNYV